MQVRNQAGSSQFAAMRNQFSYRRQSAQPAQPAAAACLLSDTTTTTTQMFGEHFKPGNTVIGQCQ